MIYYCLLYILLVYVIHELGHVLAIYAVGGKVTGFKINLRGVGVKWRGDGDLRKQVVVALSGPVANLIVFAVCGLFPFWFV